MKDGVSNRNGLSYRVYSKAFFSTADLFFKGSPVFSSNAESYFLVPINMASLSY